jgi:diguanylate cyclase (GGDEF)-like protein/PAS domain S-box-containing protein
MDEKVNQHDLLLENESLRNELHSLTQTKDELLKSNMLLGQAEKFGNLGHWERDEIADRYITCSEQYASIYGMTVKQMLEEITNVEEARALVCEADRERFKQVIDVALESKQGWNIEYCYYNAGQRVYLREIGEPVLDNYGLIIKTIGTTQDITEKRREEEEFRQSHTLFQQAEAMGNIGHFHWDLVKDKLISCSDQFARIYGMTVPEALDCFISIDAVIDLIHPYDKELFRQGTSLYNELRTGNDIEYRITTRSGNSRHLFARREISFDNDGAPSHSFGTVQDITEIRRAKEELQQSNILFSQSEAMGNMGHFSWDRKRDKMLSCSVQLAKIYDMTVSEAVDYFISTGALVDLLHPDDRELFRQKSDFYDERRKEVDIEYRVTTLLGNTRHVHVRSELILDNDGAPSHSFGTVQDITERKQSEEKLQNNNERLEIEIEDRKNTETELRVSQQRLKSAGELAKLGYWEWDEVQDCSTYYSNDLYEILDIDPGTVVNGKMAGNEDRKHIHPEDLDLYYRITMFSGGKADHFDIEYRAIRRNGDITFLREIGQAIRNDSGEIIRSIGIVLDNTDRIQVGATLRQSENRLRSLVSSSPVCIHEIDLDGKLVSMNPSGLKMMGVENESEILGLNYLDIPILEDRERVSALMDNAKLGRGSIFEFRAADENGILHFLSSFEPINDEDDNIVRLMGVTQDITARKKVEEKFSYQASHDALTGLINRSEFEQRAKRLLSTIQNDKAEHAMCFLDLDQFKVINDTCGHIAGDELLRQLGGLLRNIVRNRDTLARLGGDEFGVLMEHCVLDQAHRVADAIFDSINKYQFFWEGEAFRIGVSIGLVAITEATGNYTDLFKQADAACYLAKELGRNRIHVYHPDDVELAIRQGEMQWVGRINQALDEDRFCLYAQPIVSLDGDALEHYELLVRMLDEQGETIPPGAFLPAAERYNVIERIDTWVVEHAISLMGSHSAFVEQVNFISINLSGQSVANAQFMLMIIALIRESNIDARKICFEVTETAAISNLSAANTFITALKDLGCRFALDDFGSGLSSFGYLKNLPVDYLKIDGMFVKDMVDDPIDKAMVKSINDIGHVMGMKTIAEFVENDAIMEQLNEVGVDYAQGYGVGKPEPFNDVINQFENYVNYFK